MTRKKKRAVIAFLGNINYDTRCTNLVKTLREKGCSVKVIGFDWETPGFKTVTGEVSIYKLSKRISSIFYYLKFAFILSFRLFFKKADIYIAEDIYTLPFCSFAKRLHKGRLVYDSRELFGHLAGLKDRSRVQNWLRKIERRYIGRADDILVTGRMDGEFLAKKYGVTNIHLLRNLPLYKKTEPADLREKFNIDAGKKILLYQGAVLKGRGLGLLIEALAGLPAYVLLILGEGPSKSFYSKMAEEKGVAERVIFGGRIPQENLAEFTAGADTGTSLIENLSISYYYALPNKLFEYIMSEVPVIVTPLPQMKEVVEKYETGIVTEREDAAAVREALEKLEDPVLIKRLKENCCSASRELNWDKEAEVLKKII